MKSKCMVRWISATVSKDCVCTLDNILNLPEKSIVTDTKQTAPDSDSEDTVITKSLLILERPQSNQTSSVDVVACD